MLSSEDIQRNSRPAALQTPAQGCLALRHPGYLIAVAAFRPDPSGEPAFP
jgi:hypothetical protein